MENFNTVLLMFIIFKLYQDSGDVFCMAVFGIGVVIFIIIDFLHFLRKKKGGLNT